MKKPLQEHINFIETTLENEKGTFDWRGLSDFNRSQIGFFQHERLIHLLITLFFGLMFFESIILELLLIEAGNGLITLSFGLLALSAMLLVLLCFYVLYYFALENGVQTLHDLDREISKHYQVSFPIAPDVTPVASPVITPIVPPAGTPLPTASLIGELKELTKKK